MTKREVVKMEEAKTYKWINLRVDKEMHDKIRKLAESDYLPVASFVKQIVFEAVRKASIGGIESIR